MERYESLNGLRALCAIGIVIMHVRANVDVEVSGFFIYDNIIRTMGDFVYLFMMISAFSLCCGYYDRFKNGTIVLDHFYKRRYSRILPFFAILVLLSVIIPHAPNKAAMANMTNRLTGLSGFPPIIESIFEAIAELTLCFGLYPNPSMSIMGVGWFLGIIFIFYMMFPFFVFLIDNRKRAWISLFLSFILCFLGLIYFYSPKFVNFQVSSFNILFCAPFFLLGGIIFLYKEIIMKYVSSYLFSFIILIFLLTLLYWIFRDLVSTIVYVLIISTVMGSYLIFAVSNNTKLLHNKYIDYLSGISMEIYLCHMMSFRIVQFLHLSKYFSNIHLIYVLSCILTLIVAIFYSHIVKYKVIPLFQKYRGGRNY